METASRPVIPNYYLKWIILFGFWTFFSFLYANQVYFEMLHAPGMHHSWWLITFWQLTVWYAWGFLSPLILGFGRNFPFEGRGWWRALLVHLAASVAVAALHIALATALRMIIQPFDVWSDKRPFLLQYSNELHSFFVFDFFVYWAILGVSYAFDYRERYRERLAVAAQLETQLAQAQLQALEMQLHPHFLFNTLNAISGLVRNNKNKEAVAMIAGLSDLLRYVLDQSGRQEVTLREELNFIKLYLDIQQTRFYDRLNTEMNIEPETLVARVPNFFLQPLVENAVVHGVSHHIEASSLIISAERAGDSLRVTIFNSGPLLSNDWQQRPTGIGLSNTKARLQQLYGKSHNFELRNTEGGVEASLTIPWRVASPD